MKQINFMLTTGYHFQDAYQIYVNIPILRKVSNPKCLILSIAGKGDLTCSSQSCGGCCIEGTKNCPWH